MFIQIIRRRGHWISSLYIRGPADAFACNTTHVSLSVSPLLLVPRNDSRRNDRRKRNRWQWRNSTLWHDSVGDRLPHEVSAERLSKTGSAHVAVQIERSTEVGADGVWSVPCGLAVDEPGVAVLLARGSRGGREV